MTAQTVPFARARNMGLDELSFPSTSVPIWILPLAHPPVLDGAIFDAFLLLLCAASLVGGVSCLPLVARSPLPSEKIATSHKIDNPLKRMH